jgi:hypothetical protein
MFFGVLALIAGFFSVKNINKAADEINAIKRNGVIATALPISGFTESKGKRSGTKYYIDLKFKTSSGNLAGKRIQVSRSTLDKFESGSKVEVQYLEKYTSQALIIGDDSTEAGFLPQFFGYGLVLLGIYLFGRGYINYKEDSSDPGSDVVDFESLSSGRFYAGIGLAFALSTFFTIASPSKNVASGIFMLLCIIGTMVFGAIANAKVNAGYAKEGMTTLIALVLLFFPTVALIPLAYLFLRPSLSLRHRQKFGADFDAAAEPALAPRPSSASRTQTINRPMASGNASSGASKADQARMLIARALPQIKTVLAQAMTNGEILTTTMEVEGVKIPQDDLPIVRIACGSLVVSYVVESGKGLSYINPRQLRDSGLSADQLHATAIENLVRLTKNPQRGLAVLPQDGFFGVVLDSKSEASLLLVDELWDNEFKADTRNGVVVALPARDMLAFCDMRSTLGIAALRALTERVAPSANKALTKQLYHRVDGNWVKYE